MPFHTQIHFFPYKMGLSQSSTKYACIHKKSAYSKCACIHTISRAHKNACRHKMCFCTQIMLAHTKYACVQQKYTCIHKMCTHPQNALVYMECVYTQNVCVHTKWTLVHKMDFGTQNVVLHAKFAYDPEQALSKPNCSLVGLLTVLHDDEGCEDSDVRSLADYDDNHNDGYHNEKRQPLLHPTADTAKKQQHKNHANFACHFDWWFLCALSVAWAIFMARISFS